LTNKDVVIVQDMDESQQAYLYQISQLKDEDMELQLEHDLLLCSDHDYVVSRLKESSKKLWESAALIPNCHPVNTKITIIPQAHEYKPPAETTDPRHTKAFDFGMKIPDGRSIVDNTQILDSKKHAYGIIIKLNQDNKRLEQDMLNADPNRIFDSNKCIYTDINLDIVPTIASVFAEHEVLAWMQLRHIKIRESRIKLVRQFNFFRSIERRLSLDMERVSLSEGTHRKRTFQTVVDMYY
jgi:hypothetical protein